MADRSGAGIRTRTTVISALVVGLALLAGSVAMLWVLNNNLQSNLDSTIEAQAADRARLIDDGADPASLVTARRDESLVWITSASGQLVASGGAYQLADQATAVDLQPGPARTERVGLVEESASGSRETEESKLRVAVAESSNGTLVAVGTELEVVDKAVAEVRNLLFVGVPALLALVAGVTWLATGRTLASVEAIRRTAEEIGDQTVHRRLPVPPANDEVRRLAVTMNGMLDRLESHQNAQRRFTSDASHELRSPIANLRVLVETTRLDDSDWPESQARLLSETDRVAAIVENLLHMSVGDEGPARRNDLVHLDDIVFEQAQLVASRSAKRVDINGVSPTPVLGDAGHLSRLVRNLADNAARHAASLVTFECAALDDFALLRIGDDGPGIPMSDRERVFERFARSDVARDRESGGAGLGLAIVRSIAQSHGGEVSVSEGPNGGALFEVRLPLSDHG